MFIFLVIWYKSNRIQFILIFYAAPDRKAKIRGAGKPCHTRAGTFREIITDNRPSADVYLVAKAKAIGGTVVTEEKYKQNSAQLPNICEKLGVRYASDDEFMEIVDNNIDAGWENEQTTLLNL